MIDDTAAFVAAIAAAPVGGAELYIPAGTYRLSAALALGARSITIRGEGERVTRLLWTTNADGLVYNSNAFGQTLTIRSLSLLNGITGSTGAAIIGRWPPIVNFHGDNGFISTIITDVHIGGETLGSTWWYRGIYLENAIGSKISNFVITGLNSPTVMYTYSGIEIVGKSLGIYISAGDIWGAAYGVLALDQNEGLHISHVEVSDANYGYYVNTPGGTPGTAIEGCHANTHYGGIWLLNRGDTAVSNNLLYRLSTQNYIGIHVVNGSWNRITGNYIVPIAAGVSPTNGIVIEGTSIDNIISNNVTRLQDIGIWLVSSGANDNTVVGNHNITSGIATIYSTGTTGNFISTNH